MPESPQWWATALSARPRLISVARRVVRDPAEAEDVADEAIARLAAEFDRPTIALVPIDNVVGWLHRTAVRLATDRARHWLRRQRPEWLADVASRADRPRSTPPSAELER
ncbi:MAG: hypothetical protein KDC38_13610, partial [Planctomycetes bacterium]|nr:hypothetical protein [Planctomycetota bacterium]